MTDYLNYSEDELVKAWGVEKNYTIFDIALGDNIDKTKVKISNNFTFEDSYEITDGMRDSYTNDDTGYCLVMDYNSKHVITGISYVMEDQSEDKQQSERTQEDTQTAEEDYSPFDDVIEAAAMNYGDSAEYTLYDLDRNVFCGK